MKVEFKETLSLDVRSQKSEKYMETSALKTIPAFINSDGGDLLIGVTDKGEIRGIDAEVDKLHKKSMDKFEQYFKNKLKQRIGLDFSGKVRPYRVEVDGMTVFRVTVEPSKQPCFLDEETYLIRTTSTSEPLAGPKLAAYLRNRSVD